MSARTPVRSLLFTAFLVLVAGGGSSARVAPVARVAFGSCAHQDRPQPIWDAVLDWKPQLFVFAGDNVYGDSRDEELVNLQLAYAVASGLPAWQRLRAEVPVLATWDDHDYGQNDAGGDFPGRERSQQLFAEFWELPGDDPRRTRPGVHHAETLGPPGMRLQVILLDTRSFRSPLRRTERRRPGRERYRPDPDAGKTMLGAQQWAWLEERLREPADLRLVVSSVQVLADGHGWERWGNLPVERRRLFDLIAETGAAGVVFLSGDRHVAGLYRLDEGVPYPLHEITSSGLNMTWPAAREDGPLRLGALYGLPNFGTIDVDWWEGEVTLSVRAMNGEPKRQLTLPLAELRAR